MPRDGDINNLNNNDLPVAPIESLRPRRQLAHPGRFEWEPNTNPDADADCYAAAGALWYNGDFNDVNGLTNESEHLLGIGQYATSTMTST